MKKNIGVIMLFVAFNSLACDICNMSVSLTPDDTKHSISFLYRHRFASRTFSQLVLTPALNQSVNRHGGVTLVPGIENQTVTESYSVYEIKGVYFLNHRWSLTGSFPMIHNQRTFNGEKLFDINGVGDPIIMGRYNLLRTSYTEKNKANHRVILGSGVKLPLGKCNFEHEGELVEHDIQAGSGTLDFVFSLDYLLMLNNLGLSVNSNYKINTQNKKADYMFGNTNNSTLNLLYMKKFSETFSVVPYAGAYLEIADKDIEKFHFEENTGGKLLFGSVGTQFFIKNFRLDAFYQHVLKNKLNGNLQLNTKNRIQIGVSYLFG